MDQSRVLLGSGCQVSQPELIGKSPQSSQALSQRRTDGSLLRNEACGSECVLNDEQPQQLADYLQKHLCLRPAPQQVRDPFTPSALMYETVGKQSGMANSAYGFSPSSEGIKIPK